MVGPVSEETRRSFALKLKIGFVLLVGVSAGLITLQGDAGATGFAAATGGGLLLGVVLVRFAFPSRESFRRGGRSDRRERP